MPLGGRRRDDADPDIALDQPADRVKAAQLDPQPEATTDLFGLLGEKTLQCTRSVETDEIKIERLGKRDAFRCR